MKLPAVLRERLEERCARIVAVTPLGGGCIHSATRIDFADGPAFLKWGDAPEGMFASEARGLDALRAAAGSDLRIPTVLASEEAHDATPAWLLLEWLEPAAGAEAPGRNLGIGLAALHSAPAAGWGWDEPGWIGTLPQDNAREVRWADFWWSRRLEPQLRLAGGEAPGRPAEWSALERALPGVLAAAEEEGPSLLHGDLWSGNVLMLGSGEAALVDPAAYRGHREVDLAMAELFGGFAPGFLTAYREQRPLQPGYERGRRPIYQLYPLLVHLNLFGGGYSASVQRALRAALA